MRQLAATGWMHNRVRLVAASLLTKHLLVPWQTGERFFADALVDLDIASNVFNWQWVAGCGADAAPYFRIFNPVLQAARFDAEGEYVRRWVPEIGTPVYPAPIVDHSGSAGARACSIRLDQGLSGTTDSCITGAAPLRSPVPGSKSHRYRRGTGSRRCSARFW
jgi:deoxyribodipyrimidine photolyase